MSAKFFGSSCLSLAGPAKPQTFLQTYTNLMPVHLTWVKAPMQRMVKRNGNSNLPIIKIWSSN